MAADKILAAILSTAESRLNRRDVKDSEVHDRLDYICRCISNRACVRLLMACLLAKLDNPNLDPRKPYTEINTPDCFSGRHYDEEYLTQFIIANRLPCNSTTAFLTPGFRRGERPLTRDNTPIGRPKKLYVSTVQLLGDVYQDRVSAKALLTDAIRILIKVREENQQRIDSLLSVLRSSEDSLPLSSEQIVTLIHQHLSCRNSSRLPVLIVAAAYQAAGAYLGEQVKALNAHTAADLQTGAVGDVEICLTDENNTITAYEMKTHQVTTTDIDLAIQKLSHHGERIHNYIFVTTDTVDPNVSEYAKSYYEKSGGTEIAVLDCIGFLRHFLHFFHRIRVDFLNKYQQLVLDEPDSAVGQPLKEAFLALRHAAESG